MGVITNMVKIVIMNFHYPEASFFYIYWDTLHASLNSHYEVWSYKKKKHKKITAYRKSV